MKAKYWVISKTLWQGDQWAAIAGSFDSLEEAQKIADQEADDGWSEPVWSEQHQAWWASTQNLRNVVLTRVVNTTALRKVYGIRKAQAEETIYWKELQDERLRQEAQDYDPEAGYSI